MRALKLRIFQQIANYRKPLSYNFVDTFPLPTYSNIRGWIHSILGLKNYTPISVSIQGSHDGVFYDLQTFFKFDRPEEERGIVIPELKKSVKKSPFYVANLYNVSLIIHISMDKKYLEEIPKRIFDAFPSIGRYEDLVRIDEIKMVELEEKKSSLNIRIKCPIYFKKETAQRNLLKGLNFRIPFKYEIIEGLRYFKKIDVVYVEEGVILSDITLDEENDLVELVGDYYE
ncbi:MAG: type I-B CRISPR-associated protein Cas5b [Brevinematia bacterium]